MDLLSPITSDPRLLPGRSIRGEAVDVLIGDGKGFRTRPVAALKLTFQGIAGDGHSGFTRKSGGREPWYPRGTEIRSGRQISIISEEELAAVAAALSLPTVDAGVIGANLVIRGVPRLSFLPAGTRISFESGAVLVVEACNAPCRLAGRALADAHPGRDDLELGFVSAARRKRGVVASVERPGDAAAGRITVKIPEQWIWEG
ncbi:MOSC domain-containing protein [Chthonobacter albigriseus]|uniref:MOSC domain-containing protein n=1 Tax=Chthonobacter albigriseus TaxID=1683161 RepID=UPI0015EEF3AB|nr:MOSC domain-containing protein [Chthonobacter albigriseus]